MPALEPFVAGLRDPVGDLLRYAWLDLLFLAITQYLIIGLVTSRDKALDVLSQFDQEVEKRRQALIEEFQLKPDAAKDLAQTAADEVG